MDLIDELHSHVLCGDGAMGTSLMELADAPIDRCLEEFCLSAPDLVAKIHRQYLDAGARVIETNSFGANPARLARHGLEARTRELNTTAVRLAQRAAAGRKGVYVAGSVGPLGLTADEARERHIDRRRRLPRADRRAARRRRGPDHSSRPFLDLDEILLALGVQRALAAIARPRCVRWRVRRKGGCPDGATITEAFARLREAWRGHRGRQLPQRSARHAQTARTRPGRARSTAFRVSERRIPEVPRRPLPVLHGPGVFREGGAGDGRAGSACLVGGCCGTGPSQIAAMAAALRDLAPVTSKAFVRPIEPPPGSIPRHEGSPSCRKSPKRRRPPTPPSRRRRSILDRIAQGKTVVITELDPPKTLDLEKFLVGAKALTDAGCDAITLADNSLAILRVSNLAMGALLKARYGIMPLLHVSCRDKNLARTCKANSWAWPRWASGTSCR